MPNNMNRNRNRPMLISTFVSKNNISILGLIELRILIKVNKQIIIIKNTIMIIMKARIDKTILMVMVIRIRAKINIKIL